MDDLFEIIIDILFDITTETAKNTKVPKYIRIPLIIILSILMLAITLLTIYLGINILKTDTLIGIIFIILGVSILTYIIYKLRKSYEKKQSSKI